MLKNNQDRLWLRHRKNNYAHYFCYDKDHRISSRDTLYFGETISTKKLKFVSALMPSLKILQLDSFDRMYKGYDYEYSGRFDYRHRKNGKAVPITKIFPLVACLILPGSTEEDNFAGDLSQLKHLTLFGSDEIVSLTFPNLDSLEIPMSWENYYANELPMPSKRFVMPLATMEWSTLPKTLEVIEAGLDCKEYISIGKPHFSNLKILKGLHVGRYHNKNVEALTNFLKDHKGCLTELSFSVEKEVANIKVVLPMLTRLQKLSVKIETDKQAIEFKEIKVLVHNLQYFELSFDFWSDNKTKLNSILENLPTGLDNLSIKHVVCYNEINNFIEKVMEKVLNGDTTRVTIVSSEGSDDECRKTYAGEYVDYEIDNMLEKIVKIKPSSVRVEKKNTRIFEESEVECAFFRYFHFQHDIVISL